MCIAKQNFYDLLHFQTRWQQENVDFICLGHSEYSVCQIYLVCTCIMYITCCEGISAVKHTLFGVRRCEKLLQRGQGCECRREVLILSHLHTLALLSGHRLKVTKGH